jgi:signal transduction histidine kinase
MGAGLLLVMVATLAGSGSYGLYSYRALVKSLSGRSTELPLAAELSQQVSDLRVTLSSVRTGRDLPVGVQDVPLDNQLLRERFRMNLQAFKETLDRYRGQIDQIEDRPDSKIGDDREERATLAKIEGVLAQISRIDVSQDWVLDEVKVSDLATEVDELHLLAAELPSHLRRRLQVLSSDVRLDYRTAIIVTWVTSIAALATFVILLRLFYGWIFCPLRQLIDGSRQVAAGRFSHRIRLDSHDEMAELADAMNHMTERFQSIRDDLDRQVRERTKQVVRSERLAGVGFLAAGVAHEINNPLASIAICAESLHRRVDDVLPGAGDEQEEIRSYLQMIQQEAFRCKEITEKLLDFSRMGDVRRQRIELRELVSGVIDMVGHMGRYQEKSVELATHMPVFAEVNAQELKQVVLNLITNGLDSLEPGGKVTVEVVEDGNQAELIFRDNGCGMTDEVLEHLFEPFFTRRRGGQGTGLGLSISYRIIADHHGQIEATSDGPGQGAQFIVTLPLSEKHTIDRREYQAA